MKLKDISLFNNITFSILTIRFFGFRAFFRKFYKKFLKKHFVKKPAYLKKPALSTRTLRRQRKKQFHWMPKISVIIQVTDKNSSTLENAIQSVLSQTYDHFELYIVGHVPPEIVQARSPQPDKIRQNETENIPEAIQSTTGDYITFFNQNDLLLPNALYEMVYAINSNASPDLLYADEGIIDKMGNYLHPAFKPDWSPDLLRSYNYIDHPMLVKKTLWDQIDEPPLNEAFDYDLILRLTEKAKNIIHVPKILYFSRQPTDDTPSDHTAALKALFEHTKRIAGHEKCHITYHKESGYFRCQWPMPSDTLVSIIMPMKDKVGLSKTCVDSILKKSTWQNFEILILDNNSKEPETFEWFDSLKAEKRIRVIPMTFPYNWEKMNNKAIRLAKGNVLILINNDMEIISPDWIEQLGGLALLDHVGLASCLLLYGDGRIQNGGYTFSPETGRQVTLYLNEMPTAPHPAFISPLATRNALMLIGACFAIERRKYEAIGDLNETLSFGGDLEFCLRSHKKGFYNVFDGTTRLYHYEAQTLLKKNARHIEGLCDFLKYCKDDLKRTDPFYHPDLL